MTWPAIRIWVVWVGAFLFLMGIFLMFALGMGWPTTRDSCVLESLCYCEWFDPALVDAGATGIRQPVNTWSNLYVLITIPIMAYAISRDRMLGRNRNLMCTDDIVPEIYICAALFLGLGSMWMHASGAKHVSWADGMSMYVFAGFLLYYTINRILFRFDVARWIRMSLFIIAYPMTVLIFTWIGTTGFSSVALVAILCGAYGVLEFMRRDMDYHFWRRGWRPWPFNFISENKAWIFWVIGAGCFVIAMIARAISTKVGDWLCFPHSWFQPHGLIWHTGSGAMALMLYFYWRLENVRPGTTVATAPLPSEDRWT